jgi:hypothetical protein
MDLDVVLAAAAPAKRASLDGPDSPAAIGLYRRITTSRPASAPAFRRHRRFSITAIAGAAAAATAAAVTLTLTSSSPALAAWTVSKTPNGLVAVTIHQLRDPAGLERALRAEGVPANVQFLAHDFTPTTSATAIPAACQAPNMSDEANADLQLKIMPSYGVGNAPSGSVRTWVSKAPQGPLLTIDPSAIPSGIGLYVEAWAASGALGKKNFSIQTDLVVASPGCTGA